jgi:5-(carboxyamino)imidazole ribonucleotide synthase
MSVSLGILGGGQLGSYFVLAAKKMGYQTVVLDPDPYAPAGSHADKHIIAEYNDVKALKELAHLCSAVTIEFENPPVESLTFLAQFLEVHPSPSCVEVAQNRRDEKQFCESIGLAVAPYEVLETHDDIERIMRHGITRTHLDPFAVPLLMKTSRLGYDGKGQQKINDFSDITSLWQNVSNVPCVIEQVISLDAEFSIVLARSRDGEVALFAPTCNVHIDGILDISTAPCTAGNNDLPITTDILRRGQESAIHIAEKMNYVGVLAVEFFVSGESLFVNELAPRPHNSGHWTIDAAQTSQFEQQVRALVHLPLGNPAMTHAAVAMVNLLGDRWNVGEPHFDLVPTDEFVHLHLYGKKEARSDRKMGHITITGDDLDSVTRRAIDVRNTITR